MLQVYTSLCLYSTILYLYRVVLFSLVSCWILSAVMNSDSTLWSIRDIASAIFLSSAYRAMANDHLYLYKTFWGQSAPGIVDCECVTNNELPGIWESVQNCLVRTSQPTGTSACPKRDVATKCMQDIMIISLMQNLRLFDDFPSIQPSIDPALLSSQAPGRQ